MAENGRNPVLEVAKKGPICALLARCCRRSTAAKLVGGAAAPGPIAGEGIDPMSEALALDAPECKQVGPDVYLSGRVNQT